MGRRPSKCLSTLAVLSDEEVVQIPTQAANVFERKLVANGDSLNDAEPGNVVRQQGHTLEEHLVRCRVIFGQNRELSVDVERSRTRNVRGITVLCGAVERWNCGAAWKGHVAMLVRRRQIEYRRPRIITMGKRDLGREACCEIMRREYQYVGDVRERCGYELGRKSCERLVVMSSLSSPPCCRL